MKFIFRYPGSTQYVNVKSKRNEMRTTSRGSIIFCPLVLNATCAKNAYDALITELGEDATDCVAEQI